MLNRRYERNMASSRHHGEVDAEMRAAIEKFPEWPDDMLHAVAIVSEECGELVKDVLQFQYEPHKGKTPETIRKEAIQTIAMLHRFLNSLDTGRYTPSSISQHTFDA